MSEHLKKSVEEMTTQELADKLYELGSIESKQMSFELDEFYDAVDNIKQELLKNAKKYEKLRDTWFKCSEDGEDTIFFMRKCKEVFEDFKTEKRIPRM